MPGQDREEAAGNPMLNMEVAAPNYFALLGMPVLRGRPFSDEDRESTTPVIVVSSGVAHHFWPGSDPIGKRLAMPGREFTVVGVVPDTRYRELTTARPTVYFPLRQSPFSTVVEPSTLLIRTANTPADLVPALRRAVSDAHQGVSVVRAASLEALVDVPRAQPRLNAIVLGLFAVSAVSLAAIGLFAIIAAMVRQRTREIGIRMALGATAADVRRMVMVRGLALALSGAAIGIVGALATSRLLSTLLFEIEPTDAMTLLFVVALMLGVAALACFIPARSTLRIDPVIALRSEA
jgi:putative ABC transport system permease protein